jgi:hypothetical protein
MIDIPVYVKGLGPVVKAWQWWKNRDEEKRMLVVYDDLRRSTQRNAGNVLSPEIGSEDDHLCHKMVTKGLLEWTGMGYMLPGKMRGFGAPPSAMNGF